MDFGIVRQVPGQRSHPLPVLRFISCLCLEGLITFSVTRVITVDQIHSLCVNTRAQTRTYRELHKSKLLLLLSLGSRPRNSPAHALPPQTFLFSLTAAFFYFLFSWASVAFYSSFTLPLSVWLTPSPNAPPPPLWLAVSLGLCTFLAGKSEALSKHQHPRSAQRNPTWLNLYCRPPLCDPPQPLQLSPTFSFLYFSTANTPPPISPTILVSANYKYPHLKKKTAAVHCICLLCICALH